ncbi:hypothetical protein BYT27DRAFT_7212879 [Phlegmacium glaucopus]|nr:hypothetical protein BYT27DRAFT_7212879 [Phlegmacium glaucopus]
MHYLVNGIVATGADVFHPGQSPAPTDNGHGDDTGENGGNFTTISATSSATILDDSIVNEIIDNEPAIAPTPTPTPPVSRKQVCADSETESPTSNIPLSQKQCGRRHASQADSISGVGDALFQMAATLTSGGAQGTPVHHKKALQLVAEDGEYSDEEEDMINYLFCDDICAADTYLGISKMEKRVNFICKCLEKYADA